jgi:threonine aldolase
MLGMEEGMFCPSGTMCNQVAVRVLTRPQDEVICDEKSHIYNYEGGGIAYNSFVTTQLVKGDRGRITADDVVSHIKPDDIHYPHTALVALENTVNKGGGSIYKLSDIIPIYEVCKKNNLSMHLDGARLFNALVETGDAAEEYGDYFDTISICLSKGLGAPVGSVLLGSAELIKKARRVRKVMGGGMRQAGYLAAAGIYALDHHIKRLSEDHKRARRIAEILKHQNWVETILPVESNILIFRLTPDVNPGYFLKKLARSGVLGIHFGGQDIRFVTHLDFDDEQLDALEGILNGLTL